MKSMDLLDNLEFHENLPYAQPLNVDAHGRILRFMLKPVQSVKEHTVPNSPFCVEVLKGHSIFAGGDQVERQFGPNTILVFDPGEKHSVRALGEELVFVGFLHCVPGTRTDRSSGIMGGA